MDPPTRAQPLIRDTLHGTICILLVLFNLPPKDSLSIKDKVSAPKVSFIQRLYCIRVKKTLCKNFEAKEGMGVYSTWAYFREGTV